MTSPPLNPGGHPVGRSTTARRGPGRGVDVGWTTGSTSVEGSEGMHL